MILRIFIYFFKQALLNIKNNRIVHMVGMGTLIISLLIFGSFLLFFVNLNAWLQGWGHSLTMSVYLQDDVDIVQRDKIISFINKFPETQINAYISKDSALESLKRALGSEAKLLDGLSKNPLPASLEVVFKNAASVDADPYKIVKAIEELDGVEEVQFSEDWLKRFEGIMNMIRLVGFIIGGLLCLGVLFIVTNTIKLTIYTRKHEIEIQKLVGATDWFVKAPFLIEGIMQGLISGIIAHVILFSGYLFLSAKKVHLLGPAVLDFIFLPSEYILLMLLISAALGLLGSFIAVGRFIAADSIVDA